MSEGININDTNPSTVYLKSNAQGVQPAPWFTSPSLTVTHPGWVIIGKPTLRQLLRYWWRQRK